MEVSRISSKGQVTVPKTIRQKLKLDVGDRVAFIEDNGRIVITKASILALRELQKEIGQEAENQGITEEDLQAELEKVREDMWNERKK
ncbi:AbrB/MazE/SpoVT family DNA-binding domain-containing protein [Virgibacillus dakarensis]|uniref:AbrB family transcriptional regulator n=1 Tax=Lentibacillus populi TaxID=1827502 RepID=A0A9W5X4T1_9BACI|nr:MULTISPECIES: type II toxin-antitoxin system PrlF family antitoxin [Bacillaceae]MBT2217304.1 type II toxin-antitoxin system PrlF family antitoxin [Virgibacillus dakarensis]MTW86762.1 AbrB/MazE/SpoVT family DNA-binding domain-containing protein [Virgibacillus dakarensis]GGB38170.1 AbrB family transcriptional regulator [Lentibacillus populi]